MSKSEKTLHPKAKDEIIALAKANEKNDPDMKKYKVLRSAVLKMQKEFDRVKKAAAKMRGHIIKKYS